MAEPVQRDQGTRYDDSQREMAFRVWCYQANRSAAATARILSDLSEDEGGFVVESRSVLNWAKAGNWDDRANRDLFASAPALRFKTQTALILAAPEAAELMRKMVALDESLMTERKVYDKEGEYLYSERVFDDKILKIRQTAAQLVLDRTGFSPVGTRDVGAVDTPPELATDLREALGPGATTEQIKAMEELIKSKVGMGKKSV